MPNAHIRVYLVRYGNLKRIGWFGTIHAFPIERGDSVVVQSVEGTWIGSVLQQQTSTQQQQARGELLRLADADDLAAWNSLKTEIPIFIAAAEGQLASENVLDLVKDPSEKSQANEGPLTRSITPGLGSDFKPFAVSSVQILDADVSLDRTLIILQFVGTAEAQLGQLAHLLATKLNVTRVQWLPASTATVDLEVAPAPARIEHQIENHRSEKEIAPFINGIKSVAMGSLTGSELKRFANRHREQMGLAGCYLQKPRENPPSSKTDNLSSSSLVETTRTWMLRLRSAAGQMTVGQFRGLIKLARQHGNQTLRLTMRQGIQFHGVSETKLGTLIADVNSLAMTAGGSCGNSLRNVTCCPLQPQNFLQQQARQLASRLTKRWLPMASWLELHRWRGEGNWHEESWFDWKVNSSESSATANELPRSSTQNHLVADCAYPQGYPPHKLKLAVASADDNCVNVRANDVGIVLHASTIGNDLNNILADIWIGGGLSYRPVKPGSFPMLAQYLGRIPLKHVESIVNAIMELHIHSIADVAPNLDNSKSTHSRHFRRLKYLVNRMGAEAIAEWIESQTGLPVDRLLAKHAESERGEISVKPWSDHEPINHCSNGRVQVVVEVCAGRLRFDDESLEAWNEILQHCDSIAVGPKHTLVFSGIQIDHLNEFRTVIREKLRGQLIFEQNSNVPETARPNSQPSLQRVLTCVAFPTCPWAVSHAESRERDWYAAVARCESTLWRLIEHITNMDRADLANPKRRLVVAVSGCSNNCSCGVTTDVGIVAEAQGKFRLFLGGSGNRLGIPVAILTGPEQLPEVADRLLLDAESRQRHSS